MKKGLNREQLASRAARKIPDGSYVNLGIGLPSLIAKYLKDRDVMIHSENGLIGMGAPPPSGQEDPDLVNAGKQPVTIKPGGSICSQVESFAVIRGGHLDITVLGAFQVSRRGDVANWCVPGKGRVPGVGGAMDLVTGTKNVIVTMTHTANDGSPKILNECTFPLTGKKCVNMIITDLAVIRIIESGLRLEEIAPGLMIDDIQSVTEPKLIVSDDLRFMRTN